ncbi:hypothetical protein KDH_72450 [Dictyobacter sp. S3.2.2.5]|uniref:Aminoglycoside phosphotransferase domain-containing protein n=1 Tax=Dictyobacter halimunensis TaxID=3026934 RepID=A0ABQ6G6J0_9CHLR|nr:hypothetical protein KDH_72450 [Dictyobacter sp. S3.2.2.5]
MPSEIVMDVIVSRATAILRRSWNGPFHLEQPVLVSDRDRNQVFRCRVQGDGALPDSIIIKLIKDPLDPVRGLTDWASLAFLSQLAGEDAVAPRFLGGDADQLLFVMEDLGDEGDIERILQEGDASRATTMLCALARQMGTLHVTTMGHESLFQRMCEDLSLATVPARFREAERWLEGCQKVERWCRELDYVPPGGFEQACRRIADTFADPGDFLAFTHGDPAPTNNCLRSRERDRLPDPGRGKLDTYLIDFEYAGFRHALYDLTGWNILCPLPEDCVRLMSEQLRARLAPACPAAGRDEDYQSAWAALCSYRAMALISWMPLSLIARNEPWVGEWSGREALLVALRRWEEAARDVQDLEVMSLVAAQLLSRCQALWPDIAADRIPAWPAFA